MKRADYDIVVVGHGAAGLTAALSAAEWAHAVGRQLRIAVLERAPKGEHGGNTRFTPCYMRMEEPNRVSPDFVSEMLEVSGGRNEAAYFELLSERAPSTLSWLQAHGIEFHKPVYYLAAGPKRIQPVGGGETIVSNLTRAAKAAGVEFLYDCRAQRLLTNSSGAVSGIAITEDGADRILRTSAVVLACGGFQGNIAMLRDQFGPDGETLRPISPGTRFNTGDGIRMALEVGAVAAGDWHGMHIEPIDPRAANPAPVVLVYPYGIVVDQNGRRFFDEGAGLVHETWEEFARAVHFEAPGGIAYAVLDRKLNEIGNYGRAIRSEVPPAEAASLTELADLIHVPAAELLQTVSTYNDACIGAAQRFDASFRDGLATTQGLSPAKSNWARPLEDPPFVAWPLVSAIAYTFGGLSTDLDGRVLGSGGAIAGLFAAGEITGHFHGTAPNAVSVLRAIVYGRIAGWSSVMGLG